MGEFITGAAARERFRALLDAVEVAYAQMREISSDSVGSAFRVELAERLETQERTNRGLMYRVFGEIADPPDEVGLMSALTDSLWARLRIPPKEIKRRMKVAARIRPRRSVLGPPLPPELPLVADAVAAGAVGQDHLRAICKAMDRLPSCVSADDRVDVERSLVRGAVKNDAEIVTAAGRRIDEIFNPDGDFDEADRARRRGMVLGPQGCDGMARFSGWIDPETRCYVEAATAAVRPGRHLPDGTLAGARDDRSPSQRCHDGIKLGLKAGIWSGQLGSHRGHPVTVIVRTTLAELNQATHGIHYLAVFEDHSERPIYLGRQKRVATTDQRIICYSRDGGCTRFCEVHHSTDWAAGGATDADMLFFVCEPDHAAVSTGRWQTTVTDSGRLAWTNGTRPPESTTPTTPTNSYAATQPHQTQKLNQARQRPADTLRRLGLMRLATWNVNSIRARVDRVADWLERADVDVLAMQETKCSDEQFPTMPFLAAGYDVVHCGFNQWNGVAIASRVGLDDVTVGFDNQPTWSDKPDVEAAAEARALGATCNGVRVWSLYVPNGRFVGSPHYVYKLEWLAALRDAAQKWLTDDPAAQLALVGDWNIAPTDEDVWSVEAYTGSTHVTEPERSAFNAILDAQFSDVVRPFTPGPAVYTYWDYTQLRFPKNRGMRIDFVLGSPALAQRVTHAEIVREERKGKAPSDHAPVLVELA